MSEGCGNYFAVSYLRNKKYCPVFNPIVFMSYKLVAIHQAGHAAVHLYFNHPFKNISVVHEDGSLGRVNATPTKRLEQIMLFGSPTPSDERYLEQEMIILMAGGVAEIKYLKRKTLPRECKKDLDNLIHYCESALSIHGKALFHYSQYIIEVAKSVLDINEVWAYVEKLSELLLNQKTLKYADCEKLFNESTLSCAPA
jgi:hypothetical protein